MKNLKLLWRVPTWSAELHRLPESKNRSQ